MSKRGGKSNPKAKAGNHPQLADLLAIRKALDLLELRQFDEAKKLCLEVIGHADLMYANHALGLIASAQLDYAGAETWLQKAVQADPTNPEYRTNLGIALLRQDKIDAAIQQFEAAIAESPEHAGARIGLADALHEKNDPEATIAYFEDAMRRAPNAPGPIAHLGKALIDAGRHQEAVDTLLKAMALQINYAPAHTNLGIAFHEMGMLDEALQCHVTAQMLDGEDIYALNKMADTYIKQRNYDKAHEVYRRVIEIAPNDPNSHLKLGSSLYTNEDRYDDAMQLFQHARGLNPDHAITYNNIGATMYDQGHTEEAMAHFDKAIALWPNYKMARHNMALGQLLRGDFKAGWENHEVRLTLNERKAVYALTHKLFQIIPQWDGKSSLEGKYILLMHEQGFGDAIQFVRYAKVLQAQGARVAVHVIEPLERLFRTLSPDVTLVRHSDPLPKCDCAYLMMSLPHALGTHSAEHIPAHPSYLSASAEDTALWKQSLQQLAPAPKLRVGLVWAGNPEHGSDRKRSIPLNTLAPLLDIEGIQFVSLQKGGRPEDIERLENEFRIVDAGRQCADFADTAGVIANLDLVISVDTSVVHLAGAMGAPTWTLLAYTPDWRWLTNRTDSPWYPGMRLFRQQKNGDWPAVIADIKTELLKMRDNRKILSKG